MPTTREPGHPARSGRLDYAAMPVGGAERYLKRPRPAPGPPLPIRTWVVLLAVALGVYSFIFSSRGILSLMRMRRETTALDARIRALDHQRAGLLAERQRLTEGDAVEEYARELYHYVRDGEEIYLLPVLTPDEPGGDRQPEGEPGE